MHDEVLPLRESSFCHRAVPQPDRNHLQRLITCCHVPLQHMNAKLVEGNSRLDDVGVHAGESHDDIEAPI